MKKIDDDTLATLSALAIAGTHVRIMEQLDRAAYTKVNKVLEAIGGTWSRKEKAHVFASDPTSRLDSVIVTGEVETARDVGFFETDPALARDLVKMAGVKPGDLVLEPSAGTGRIITAIMNADANVIAVERDPDRRKLLTDRVFATNNRRIRVVDVDDFMAYDPARGVEGDPQTINRVVMNPPFAKVGSGDHLDHVKHAYSLLVPGGVLVSVMPSSITFRRDRRHTEFRAFVEERGTTAPLPPGSFKKSGTNVGTVTVSLVRR